MELEDDVVIVTGGSTGIGRAAAERLIDEGAEVAIFDINDEEGEETAEELGCSYYHCDVSDPDEVKEQVDAVVDDLGRLDCIVNNAGIGRATKLEDLEDDEWEQVMSVNLDGVMHGSRAALPHLKETGGSIINIASIYGLVAGPGSTAYAASKGGVVNFTRTVATDYAAEGVRCNAVCPGFVKTPMTDDYLDDEEFYSFVKAETPMGRVAEPHEIAGVVAFLASDDASYITGACLPVDGGWTAH